MGDGGEEVSGWVGELCECGTHQNGVPSPTTMYLFNG